MLTDWRRSPGKVLHAHKRCQQEYIALDRWVVNISASPSANNLTLYLLQAQALLPKDTPQALKDDRKQDLAIIQVIYCTPSCPALPRPAPPRPAERQQGRSKVLNDCTVCRALTQKVSRLRVHPASLLTALRTMLSVSTPPPSSPHPPPLPFPPS